MVIQLNIGLIGEVRASFKLNAILRAGRDRIEKAPSDSKMQQRETEDVVDVPYCIMPSKEI